MNPLWLGVLMALLAVYAGLVWFAFSTARKVERLVPPLGQFVEVALDRPGAGYSG